MRSLVLAAASLLAASCGVSSADDDESCREAANRPFLAACCPDDPGACEPGLVCVAGADGSGPACRKEDGAACAEYPAADAGCASGECREWLRLCRSSPGAACTLAIGCASPGGVLHGCVDGICRPRGDAAAGEACSSGADCDSARCEGGVCVVPCATRAPLLAPCDPHECADGCFACDVAILDVVPDAPLNCWPESEDYFCADIPSMARSPSCAWEFCEWWGRVEAAFPQDLPDACR